MTTITLSGTPRSSELRAFERFASQKPYTLTVDDDFLEQLHEYAQAAEQHKVTSEAFLAEVQQHGTGSHPDTLAAADALEAAARKREQVAATLAEALFEQL